MYTKDSGAACEAIGGRSYNRPMRTGTAATAALLLTIGAALGAADATDRVARVVAIAAGTPIFIDATVADVSITASSRSDVRVDLVRHAPTAGDLAVMPAVVDLRADGLHVSAVQDRDGRDPRVRSVIEIAAPAGAAQTKVRVFEGRVRLLNVKGGCDVDLRRGAIEAAGLAGRVRLEAGIGAVDVRDSDLTPGGMMRLRVFNGPLRVRFERMPANGRILAVTLNGGITSDIPLTMKDRFGPRFGETTLGSADPVLSMDVVKGDIGLTVSRR